MKQGHSTLVTAALVGTLGMLHTLSVAAQESAASAIAADATTAVEARVPSANQPAVDEKKLDQFADAYVKIQTLSKDAEKQPPSSDPATAQQKQSELQTKMTEAVQQSGLEVAEFNQIAQAMASDTDLRDRIQVKVQEHSKQGS